MNYLSIELRKTKRRGIWLVPTALILFIMMWLGHSYTGHNGKLFAQFGWKDILYNTPLLNAILVPTAIAVLASRVIDMEHKGNMWKQLETMQSRRALFFAKVQYGFCAVFLFSLAEVLGFLVLGTMFQFAGTPDWWALGLFFVQTLVISFNLYLLQMIISIVFSNQAVALCIGLCGSMAGLFLMFLPQCPVLRCIIPWGHYGATMFVGMDWNEETKKVVGFYYMRQGNGAVFFIAVWFLVLIVGGWLLFQNMDTDGYHFQGILGRRSKNAALLSQKPVHIPALPTELMKVKRTPIWLAFLVLPLISAVIGTANFLNNIEILTSGWYSLWTQVSLFLCYVFMPPLLGVYASYLWRLEHSGTNWNMILTHSSAYRIVWNKLAVCAVVSLFSMLWLGGVFIVCGRCAGITAPVPVELWDWLFFGFIGSVSVCAVQLFLSLIIRSFAVPIGLGLVGGVAGLVVTAKGFEYALPYGLLSIGLRANNPNRALNYELFLTSSVIFILLFYLLSVAFIKHNDVKTQG